MFELQRIRYREDELRKRFFKEHPWELARPVQLLENDGDDTKHHDWSKITQTGKQLSGESVVQRQLYLMTQVSPPMTKDKAYLHACQEFYKLRTFEAVEKRIAMEEAMAFGAQFNKSQVEVGLELEAKVIADWRIKALQARNLVQPVTPNEILEVTRKSHRSGDATQVETRPQNVNDDVDDDDDDVFALLDETAK